MPRMIQSRIKTFRGCRHLLAAAALVPLLLVQSAGSKAQGDPQPEQQPETRSAQQDAAQSDVYFADSGRDRTPAITAFPKYPSVARRDRVEGEATVCFTVNAKGQVIRPGIRSSSHKVFERPALAAIRASTFEPLKPGESKSNLKTCRIYRFKLAPIEVSDADP